MGRVTDDEREMLAFERQWWKRPGAKDAAIRDLFDLTPTEYYRRLGLLLDNPAALELDPTVVMRLRRLRDERRVRRGRLRAAG